MITMENQRTFEMVKEMSNAFLRHALSMIEIALGEESKLQQLESLKKALKDKHGELLRELEKRLDVQNA